MVNHPPVNKLTLRNINPSTGVQLKILAEKTLSEHLVVFAPLLCFVFILNRTASVVCGHIKSDVKCIVRYQIRSVLMLQVYRSSSLYLTIYQTFPPMLAKHTFLLLLLLTMKATGDIFQPQTINRYNTVNPYEHVSSPPS